MGIELDIGMHINDWTLIEYVGKTYWMCECICGTRKRVRKYELINGTSKSCGCSKHRDLVGKQIGHWKIIKYAGDKRYTCQCDCGTVKDVYGNSLRNGDSTSCGGPAHTVKFNLEGQQFGEWEVLYYTTHNKWMCRCECGTVKEVGGFQLRNGTSKSCGHTHKLIDLAGKSYGELTVKEYAGNGMWLCTCSCGNTKYVLGKSLRNGSSISCGCSKLRKLQLLKNTNRTPEQLDIISSPNRLRDFILKYGDDKPSYLDIATKLGITYPHIVKVCNKYGLGDLVGKHPNYMQNELYEFVRDCVGDDISIIREDRSILKGVIDRYGVRHTYELDIYIPDKKLAIEFNGDYWHSIKQKDAEYHQFKTIECAKKGIRLIHIFEYEWESLDRRKLICQYLKDVLVKKSRINARDTYVVEIDYRTASEFLHNNHLQGEAKANICLALVTRETKEIVEVMTFGQPRYATNYQYELIRLCALSGIIVIGGTDKLFKYFLRKYNPKSIITYADITKFTGNIYKRIGMTPVLPNPITQPGYVWVNPITKEVRTRYQTNKQKLVEAELGNESESETDIMERLGFVQVYNSGNIKYQYGSVE